MKYDIYSSYSRNDSDIVLSILNSLIYNGFNVIHDESQLYSGEDFADKIIQYITQSKVVLLFLSENSAKSAWVRREIEFAQRNDKIILPVILSDEYRMNKYGWFSNDFLKLNAIHYNPKDLDSTLEELISTLKRLDVVSYSPDKRSFQNHNSVEPDRTPKGSSSKTVEPKQKQYGNDAVSSVPDRCQKSRNINIEESSKQAKPSKHMLLTAVITSIMILSVIGIWYFANTAPSSDEICEELVAEDTVGNNDSEVYSEVLDSAVIEEPYLNSDNDSLAQAVPNQDNQIRQEIRDYEAANDSFEFNYIFYLIAFLAGFGLKALLSRKKKTVKDNIKLSSNIASKISIDGAEQKEILPREVYSTYLDEGDYLIDFEDKSDAKRHQTYNHTVRFNECKLLFADFNDQKSQEIKTIKCFIAGSTSLQRERDALRAVTCVMYNKWVSKDFRILSYTFEDFDRASVIDGHQKQYNDFIVNEADWALFIIDGALGGITKEEYRIAMNAYKKNGRPRILAMAKDGADNNEEVAILLDEIRSENQYWSKYADIKELKHIFESTLNWDLINIYH